MTLLKGGFCFWQYICKTFGGCKPGRCWNISLVSACAALCWLRPSIWELSRNEGTGPGILQSPSLGHCCPSCQHVNEQLSTMNIVYSENGLWMLLKNCAFGDIPSSYKLNVLARSGKSRGPEFDWVKGQIPESSIYNYANLCIPCERSPFSATTTALYPTFSATIWSSSICFRKSWTKRRHLIRSVVQSLSKIQADIS